MLKMEYKIAKAELGNDWLFDTLTALSRCMAIHGLPLYVVGAVARDISMILLKGDTSKRRTKDLDVAIAIKDWQSFDTICNMLQNHHFKRHGKTQKFFYEGKNGDIDYEVDLVPFGGVAVDEKICWPPEGNPVMSVKCFQDVMKSAVNVSVDDGLCFKMAPLCGQFLIKFDAWNDRNALTSKDAEDMVFILRNYLNACLSREESNIPPDVVTFDNEKLDTAVWGAQWLAYDISKLLTTSHLQFYTDLIGEELRKEEKSTLIYHFMKFYGESSEENFESSYESCRQLWKSIEEVFAKELEERSSHEG